MIKLPRIYQTTGVKYKIQKTKEKNSDFDETSQLIKIGTFGANDFFLVECLLHEMLEASFAGAGYRYENNFGEKVFVVDHQIFRSMTGELARGVLDLIEVNQKRI